MLAALFFLPVAPLSANPSGEAVRHGDVQFEHLPGYLKILQASDKAIIDWENFSIPAGELTEFFQPGSKSAALNRVHGASASQIEGALRANGQVFLINPSGILVGPGGSIDVAGFVGSTLDVSDANFLAGGDLVFQGSSQSGIVNLGRISALDGDVILIASQVDNGGTLSAPNGTVGLAAGNDVLLTESGGERLFVRAASGAQKGTGVNNTGSIEASVAELKAYNGNIYALAINNEGRVAATGISQEGGQVFLRAGGGKIQNSGEVKASKTDGSGGRVVIDAGEGGQVANSGTVDARGETGAGGEVTVLGSEIDLFAGSLILADGETSGGSVQIGGSAENLEVEAARVTAAPGSRLSANGGSGSGGVVTIGSPGSAVDYAGTLSASSREGAGGQIVIQGQDVNLSAGGSADASGKTQGGQIDVSAIHTVTIDGSLLALGELGNGGAVKIQGTDIALGGTSFVNVSGGSGGGYIFAGGGARGEDPSIRNAQSLFIADGARLVADALNTGNGGQIVAFAEGRLTMLGHLSARGGSQGGNGGFVETSGKEETYIRSLSQQIDVRAVAGQNGMLLIDPIDITIYDYDFGIVDYDGEWTYNSIGDDDISTYLETIGSLTIDTGDSGADPGDIVLLAAGEESSAVNISWTSDNSLSFIAARDFLMETDTAISTSGAGGVFVTAGGLAKLDAGASITTNTGEIKFTSDSVELASGSSLESTSGNLTAVTNAIALDGASLSSSGDFNVWALASGTSIGVGDSSTGDLNLNLAELAALQDGFAHINIGDATGAVNVTAVEFTDPVAIYGSTIGVDGQITGSDDASVTLSGPGTTTTLNANIVTVGNGIEINDSVILGDHILLDTTNGGAVLAGADVSISGSVNGAGGVGGPQNLTIYAGTNGVLTLSGTETDEPQVNIGNLTLGAGDFSMGGDMAAKGNISISLNTAGVSPNRLSIDNQLTALGSTGTISLSAYGIDVTAEVTGSTSGVVNLTAARDITVSGAAITGTDGNVTVEANQGGPGTSGAFSGVSLSYGGAIVSDGLGNVTVRGRGGDNGTGNHGVTISGDTSGIFASSSGEVLVEGVGGADAGGGNGVNLDTLGAIESASGNLTVNGTANSGAGSGLGIAIGNGARISTTGAGNMILNAQGAGSDADLAFLVGTGNQIGSSAMTGDITLNVNTLDLETGSGTVQSSGNLNITPRTASNSIGIGTGATGTLNLSGTEIGTFQDGFSSITIGDMVNGTGAVDVEAVTFTDPIAIASPAAGGSINVDGQITGSDNASVTLMGSGATTTLNAGILTEGNLIMIDDKVVLGADVTLDTTDNGQTAGANVSVTGAVDGDGTARDFTVNAGTGGEVSLGGAVGAGGFVNNVEVDAGLMTVGSTITVANGLDIYLDPGAMGRLTLNEALSSTGGAGAIELGAYAIDLNSTISNTGTGTITLLVNQDINLTSGSSISGVNGDIELTANRGEGSTSGTFEGIRLTNASISSTGSGNIELNGKGGDTSAPNDGVSLNGGSTIQSSGTGAILVDGIAPGTGNGVRLDASQITSASGNIEVDGTAETLGVGVALLNGSTISSTGAANIEIDGKGGGGGSGIAFVSGTGNGIGGASMTGDITLNADTVEFDTGTGTLQSAGNLVIAPLDPGTSIGIGDGAAGVLNLSSAEIASFVNGFSSITIGDTVDGNGAVDIQAITFNDPVTIAVPATGGTIAVNGLLQGLDDASVSLIGPGATTTLNANIVTAANYILIDDSVLLGTDILLDTTNGGGSPLGANVTIEGTVDGLTAARNFSIHAGSGGEIFLNGEVGGTDLINHVDFDAGALTLTNDLSAVNDIDIDLNIPGGSRLGIEAALNSTGGSGNITLDAFGIDVSGSIGNTGSGAVTLTGTKDLYLVGGSISVVNGNASLFANQGGTPESGSFSGISMDDASIESTGSGNILLQGKGGDESLGSDQNGIVLQGSQIDSTGTGSVTLEGTARGGENNNGGVELLDGSGITSNTGKITITGQGAGTGEGNTGVLIGSGSWVSSVGISEGAAAIEITGTGGSGTDYNAGILMQGYPAGEGAPPETGVSTLNGNVTLMGYGKGTGFENDGLTIIGRGTVVATGSSEVVIQGTATDEGGSGAGLRIGISGSHGEGFVGTSGSGDLILTVIGAGGDPDLKMEDTDSEIGKAIGTGNILINADTVEIGEGTVKGTGDLTFKPRDSTATIGLGDGATGLLNLNVAEIGNLADGFNSITIGDAVAGSGDVDVTGFTFTDPLTITSPDPGVMTTMTFSGPVDGGTHSLDLFANQFVFDAAVNAGVITVNLTGTGGSVELGAAVTGTAGSTILGTPGQDEIVFMPGGSFSGSADGMEEFDTLDYINFGSDVTVNLGLGQATGLGSFTSFENFFGSGTANDLLVGTSAGDTFNITSNNAGTVGGNVFTFFENLNGGNGNDVFNFTNQASLGGTVFGGGGVDQLIINDQNFTTGHTYTIFSDRVERNPVYRFNGVELITLLLGSGPDIVNTDYFTYNQLLDPGAGTDTLNFLTAPAGSVSPISFPGFGTVFFSNFEILNFGPEGGIPPVIPAPEEDTMPDPDGLTGDLGQLLQGVGNNNLPGTQGPLGNTQFETTLANFDVTGTAAGLLQQVFAAQAAQSLLGEGNFLVPGTFGLAIDGSNVLPSEFVQSLLALNLSATAQSELLMALFGEGNVPLLPVDGILAIDLSGTEPGDGVKASFLLNLTPQAQAELEAALGGVPSAVVVPFDGPAAIDPNDNPPPAQLVAIMAENLGPAALYELVTVFLEFATMSLGPEDGVVAMDFSGTPVSAPGLNLLTEQLSDASLQELQQALGGGGAQN